MSSSKTHKKRRRTSHSHVWEHANRVVTEGIISGSSCKYCPTEWSATTSTSVIQKHMSRKHGLERNQVGSDDDETILIRFFTNSNSSFNMIEDKDFKEIMVRKMSPFSADSLRNKIVNMAKKKRDELRSKYSGVDCFCLICDGWKNPFGNHVFGVGLRYLDEKFIMHEEPVYIKVTEKHTNGDVISNILKFVIGKEINETYRGLDIEERVVAITADGGSDMIRGAKLAGITRVYCFNHILNLAIQEFLSCTTIKPLFMKCRDIVDFFSRSDVCLPLIEEEEYFISKSGKTFHSICGYTKTRWLSACKMFCSITYNLRSLEVALNEKNKMELMIDKDDYDLLEKITDILNMLNDIHLISEMNATNCYSHLHPLFVRIEVFVSSLIKTTSNSLFAEGLQSFQIAFCKRFKREYTNLDTIAAMIMHPLHKDLNYLNCLLEHGMKHEDILTQKTNIKIQVEKHYLCWYKENLNITENDDTKYTNPLLQDIIPSKCIGEKEFHMYMGLNIDQASVTDPYSWWKDHKSQFPNLHVFARRFLVIAGSSAFIERLWSKGKDICDSKRASMNHETMESLLFLKEHI